MIPHRGIQPARAAPLLPWPGGAAAGGRTLLRAGPECLEPCAEDKLLGVRRLFHWQQPALLCCPAAALLAVRPWLIAGRCPAAPQALQSLMVLVRLWRYDTVVFKIQMYNGCCRTPDSIRDQVRTS